MKGYTYLLASNARGTPPCGVTSDLRQRSWQHQDGITGGSTARHAVKRLVWYQQFELVVDAIAREKAIKGWPRAWKIELIEKENTAWRDLYGHLMML